MHEVLVNRLGGLSLPRKSVVRLTDRPDMTLDVYRRRKATIQQYNMSTVLRKKEIFVLLLYDQRSLKRNPAFSSRLNISRFQRRFGQKSSSGLLSFLTTRGDTYYPRVSDHASVLRSMSLN